MWILQTLPSVVFGLFVPWLRAPALLAGWAVGFVLGTWLIWSDGLKPIHTLAWGDSKVSIYTGLIALVVNIVVVLIVNPLSRRPTVTVMSRT